jgi:hypothetical protein
MRIGTLSRQRIGLREVQISRSSYSAYHNRPANTDDAGVCIDTPAQISRAGHAEENSSQLPVLPDTF